MISPFMIPLRDGLFLDLRADNLIQIFDGLPFDAGYCDDAVLLASERNRMEAVKLKNSFMSKLLVNDYELADLIKNISSVIDCGSDCVLRCMVFCERLPLTETLGRIERLIQSINDKRGRNYGGLVIFIVSRDVLGHLDVINHMSDRAKDDWEYNHVTPALLVTSEEGARRSPDALHWLRFQTCTELDRAIPLYSNADAIIDLSEILKTGTVEDISKTLYEARLSKGYSRMRLYPFALHKLLFEPNSIYHCSCSSRAFSSYFGGCLHNGCFVSDESIKALNCSGCVVSHLCGCCAHAFRNGECIFRRIFEMYYSMIAQKNMKLSYMDRGWLSNGRTE